MKVSFFHRRRFANANFSIESTFDRLRAELAGRIEADVILCPHYSKRIIPRVANVLHARQNQAEVNHVTGDVNYLAIGLDPSRTILTHHDASFVQRTQGLRRFLLKLFWLRLPVARARFVTTVSHATKQDLLSHIHCDASKIVVISNAISEQFKVVPNPQLNVEPRILQVGTALNKNIERLAASLVGISCQLVIIGVLSTSQLAALRDANIRFTSLVDLSDEQIREQYALADIVAFASTIEGFGLPILEAQATGRVVVTSNCSSMPEVAGAGACFVDPLSVQSIRQGLLRVISDAAYRRSLIELGLQNVQRFSQQAIANQYYELYEAIAHADHRQDPSSQRPNPVG